MLGEKYLIPGFEKSEFDISFIHIFNLVEALSISFGMKNIKNTSREDLNDNSSDRIELHYYCPTSYLYFLYANANVEAWKKYEQVCTFDNKITVLNQHWGGFFLYFGG